VAAKAPRSARWALGQGFTPLLPHSLIMTRRMGHLVQLLRRRPAGFVNSWERLVADALATSIARLRRRRGDDERRWAWGQVRPLRFKHTFGEKRPLDLLFNIGPLDGEGDAHTVCQGAVDLSDPFADQISAPVLRVVIDVGAWDDCRFALAGGQSGNPCSPQYADQLPHWRSAGGIPIAWGEEHVRQRATSATLKLFPRT